MCGKEERTKEETPDFVRRLRRWHALDLLCAIRPALGTGRFANGIDAAWFVAVRLAMIASLAGLGREQSGEDSPRPPESSRMHDSATGYARRLFEFLADLKGFEGF